MDVGGWSEKKVVPPLIVANVQAAILVHPVDKSHDMEDCGFNLNDIKTHQARSRFRTKSTIVLTVEKYIKSTTRLIL